MAIQKKLLRIIKSPDVKNHCRPDKGDIQVGSVDYITEMDDCIVMESSAYAQIFGKPRQRDCDCRKRLAVVKVSCNGKSIHRAFRAEPAQGFTNNYVALTSNSIRLLSDRDFDLAGKDKDLVVDISKGSSFLYYWNHPFHATRISMRLGFPSLIIGIVSLILGLI